MHRFADFVIFFVINVGIGDRNREIIAARFQLVPNTESRISIGGCVSEFHLLPRHYSCVRDAGVKINESACPPKRGLLRVALEPIRMEVGAV